MSEIRANAESRARRGVRAPRRSEAAALARASDRAAGLLRSLSHPGRLRIVCALLEGEKSAAALAREAGLSAPAFSQQAAVLTAAGLLARRREAQTVRYRLVGPEGRSVAALLHELYCEVPRS